MTARRKTPRQRFIAKVERIVDGCWTWTGARDVNGYGRFSDGLGKIALVHRWSYEFHKGAIPPGLQVDHLCRNRACVNPEHLEAVTQHVNIMRGEGVTAVNAVKTECDSGHPFTNDNTYVNPAGSRECRTCRRERNTAYKRRKRAERRAYSDELDTLAPAFARINSG